MSQSKVQPIGPKFTNNLCNRAAVWYSSDIFNIKMTILNPLNAFKLKKWQQFETSLLWLIRRCRHCSVIQLAFVLSYPNCQLTTEKRANLEIGSLCNLCIVSWDYKHPCEWAYKFWSTLKNGAPLVGHGKFRLPRQPYSKGKGKKICFMLASGVLLLVFGQSINNS